MTMSFYNFKELVDYADGHQRVHCWGVTCTHFEITGNITQQTYLKAVDLEPSEILFLPLFMIADKLRC